MDIDIAQQCLAGLLLPFNGLLCEQNDLVPGGGADLGIVGAAEGIHQDLVVLLSDEIGAVHIADDLYSGCLHQAAKQGE